MKRRLPFLPLAALILSSLSCILQMDAPAGLSPDQVETFAAQTLAFYQYQTFVAQGTQAQPPAADTLAPPPAGTDPVSMPSVTNTSFIPSVTPTPLPCNWAQFIADVTIPDDWETSPSDHFTKTWRLKNIGSCTWTSGYSLVFDHGDQMGAPAVQQLTTGTVAPGGTIDVSVDLLSPNVAGTYQGFFKLRASDSAMFGIGTDANTAFWVKIVVKAVLAPPVAAPATQQKSKTVSTPAGGTMSATAVCDAGSVVTGGGFSVNLGMHVYTQAKNGNGWAVVVKNNTATAQNLTVYAICLTLPSVSTTMASASVSVGAHGNIKADCPVGSVVTGGGFTGKPDGSLWTYLSAQSGNGWSVSAKNSAAVTQEFEAYAVCLSDAPVTTSSSTGYKDLAPGATGLAEVVCPAGQVITGGGWSLNDDLTVFAALMSGGKWRVYAKNNGTHTRTMQARGVCLAV
ncbi:MAG: hypothetical protein JW748_12450 [Anaerolineales bacterium]|nr:hypothetical protein [Anaerolineales bacterium]